MFKQRCAYTDRWMLWVFEKWYFYDWHHFWCLSFRVVLVCGFVWLSVCFREGAGGRGGRKRERERPRWLEGQLISRGGILQLVNSVLSSIPIYFMTCFRLPKWVVEKMDKFWRNFLWGKNDGGGWGVSLMNWHFVCTPSDLGGGGGEAMGFSNLEFQNISLLLRWWWRAYTNPTALWTTMVTRLLNRNLCSWTKPLVIEGIFLLATTTED